MHATERPFLAVIRNVSLSDDRLQSVCIKLVLAEDSGKESPRILTALNVNHECAPEFSFYKDHRIGSPDLISQFGSTSASATAQACRRRRPSSATQYRVVQLFAGAEWC